MLHPSYSDLINAVNSEAEEGDQLVQSRYSIVIATAKRARQIIKDNKLGLKKKKALSIAIDEIYNQKVKIILGEEPVAEEETTTADWTQTEDVVSDAFEGNEEADGDEESEEITAQDSLQEE